LEKISHEPLGKGVDSFVIKRGDSLSSVSNRLSTVGIVSDPRMIMLVARLNGMQARIKAGEYQINTDESLNQLLDKFTRGEVVRRAVRLIDGHAFSQFRESLAGAEGLKQTIGKLKDEEIMERLGHPGKKPEGLFFPATYDYQLGDSDMDILRRAYHKMQSVLSDVWKNRAHFMLKTPYEALILASIVEKETARPDERPLIAGVFLNRLKKGMMLQTDPTVIYGMGDAYKGNIRKKDLLKDTPYNTYTRFGLPPTPIANPGREALVAVLHPAKTSALYFVAKGDGSHYFSTTLAEHNKAVYRYQIARQKP